jgi:DNA-binding NarL/FixJ family response regulator
MTRFLIADDSAFLRARLAEVISEKEAAVVGQAGDVESVLLAVDAWHPDVIILDIRMPGGNGVAALEKIKKRKNPPVVIMCTNYPYLQYRKKCMDLGADFFFYKAVDIEKLVQLVRKLAASGARAS